MRLTSSTHNLWPILYCNANAARAQSEGHSCLNSFVKSTDSTKLIRVINFSISHSHCLLPADVRFTGCMQLFSPTPSIRLLWSGNKWHADRSQPQFSQNKRLAGNARGQCWINCECCNGQWTRATSHEMMTCHRHSSCAVSPPNGAQLHAIVSRTLSDVELYYIPAIYPRMCIQLFYLLSDVLHTEQNEGGDSKPFLISLSPAYFSSWHISSGFNGIR